MKKILVWCLVMCGVMFALGFWYGNIVVKYEQEQRGKKLLEYMKVHDPNLYKYWSKIVKYSYKYKISPYWVASVLCAETGFQPKRVSHAGARGIAQIMPSTARWLAQETGIKYIRYMEPENQIIMCSYYLKKNLVRFGGNIHFATAAYNCGEGNAKVYHQIPETRVFVQRVMKHMNRYKQSYERS